MQTTSFVVGSLFIPAFSRLPRVPIMLRSERSGFAKTFGLRCIWPDVLDTAPPTGVVLDDFRADWISRASAPLYQQHLIRRAWES
jgi:hypothetical protein